MNPEGAITVRLACRAQRVHEVRVTSSRTGLPPRLVRGRAPGDVRRLVPLLFSICRQAQGAASTMAIAAAQGEAVQDADRRALDVVVETLQEGLWRMLIDWPKAMDEPTAVPAVAAVRHAGNAVVDAGASLDNLLDVADTVLREHVYGTSASNWLAAMDLSALDRWIEHGATLPARLLRRLRDEAPGLGRSDVALLPEATLERLSASVFGAMENELGFARFPCWDGAPAETGAVARRAAAPLVAAVLARDGRTAATRFVARLVELAAMMNDLRTGTHAGPAPVRGHALPDGVGIGVAETARGLLLHRVRIERGLVTDYSIVAPTEWNFHPNGPLPQALAGRSASDPARLQREARTVVQSLDPCVACAVELADA